MSSSILLSITSSYVRFGLRIYFTIAFLIIGFLGDRCLASRSRRRLLHQQQLSLSNMTGWLTDMSMLTAIARFRRLPGGVLFGLLMLISTILSLTADFAVTGLVRSVNVASRCPFGMGLVIPEFGRNTWDPVPNNGAPYFAVAQAQLTSAANGGLVGIYWKVNRDMTFSADETDSIGSWNCTDVDDDIEYVENVTIDEILNDLRSRGYLYFDDTTYCRSAYGNGTFSHLLILDSSAGVQVGQIWDVRASIDLTPFAMDIKIMKSFHCTMNASAVNWALEGINSTSTLETWCLGLQANVYDGTGTGAKNNSGWFLEQYLNSMVMVAAGNNYLLATPPTTGNGGGDTQGCLVTKTSVPLEITLLFVVVTVGLFVLAIYLCALNGRRWVSSRNSELGAGDQPPNGLLGWMEQAVKEHYMARSDTVLDMDHLKLGRFGKRTDGSVGIGLGFSVPNRGTSSRRPRGYPASLDGSEIGLFP